MSSLNLSNAVSPVMCELLFFHDVAMYMILFVGSVVCGIFFLLVWNPYYKLNMVDFGILEIMWTILPGMVLFVLALPSLKLLYYIDLSTSDFPDYTLKVVGHQWYWSYGCKNFKDSNMLYEFDSYMVGGDLGSLRLLEVDLPVVVPSNSFIRLLIGSSDVIHSFTVKGLGVKVDAVPGRLSYGYFFSLMFGSFFGQCSEICGVNHSFMPIKVEVVKYNEV